MGKMVDKKQLGLLKALANSEEGEYIPCPNIKCENCVLSINSTDCYGLLSKREEGIKFAKEYLEKYIKEDNMEKNFREVVRDIKDDEVWEVEGGFSTISKTHNGNIEIEFEKEQSKIRSLIIDMGAKYKLQRKQYTFTEAFKAYEEGKEIESITRKYKKNRW